MSDRIYVMRDGRIAAEIPHTDATQERIIEAAMGADEVRRNRMAAETLRSKTWQ